ncbi:cytochrome P450 CYP82D47-like [Ipomoea triloba]|uniref:cytochrome P450 CYP82D47-like n=1 Tax=Ipomoea triloba TaxID=35885 RepID=UPI00125E3EBB|nr:cytochrome P450 CYP82D47-like [Ipomoea triloba]
MDIITYLSSIFALAAVLLVSLSWRRARKSSRSAPEAGGAWPIVGHLHLLRAPVPLVKTLSALAEKHGSVFMIRLGMPRALVVSSWEAVKDCFATNDKLLATRPTTCAGKYLGYDYAVFSFSTYNSYWRKIRKLVVVELLSNRRLEKLKHVWVTELQANIKELYTTCSISVGSNINPSKNKVINMSQWFEHLTLNLIVKVVAGRRYEYRSDGLVDQEAECMKKVFKEVMFLWGEVVSGDTIFPLWLFRWLDYEGHVKTMKRVAKALDAILQDWVDARKRENGKNEDQGFIDVMLSMIDDQFLEGQTYTRDTIIKATVLSMLQDGSETFSVHFIWILSLLLKNREALERLQEEIDANVGRERWVEDSDIKNLPYLHAVVKETLRLYPPAPFLVPHEAIEDCTIGGYHIPKGTQLYVNVWKLHRDPQVWPDPEKFSPERFLTNPEDSGAHNRQFQFVPFGFGRRSCPGMLYATQITHLAVARLVQGFNFNTPSNEALDMSEGLGITMPRANPLEVVITPRLPSALYGLHH